jgi:hypothetical protein
MPELKDYLGDGVYAISDEYGGIWLHANDHENPTDSIYLEPKVFDALVRFEEKVKPKQKEEI